MGQNGKSMSSKCVGLWYINLFPLSNTISVTGSSFPDSTYFPDVSPLGLTNEILYNRSSQHIRELFTPNTNDAMIDNISSRHEVGHINCQKVNGTGHYEGTGAFEFESNEEEGR